MGTSSLIPRPSPILYQLYIIVNTNGGSLGVGLLAPTRLCINPRQSALKYMWQSRVEIEGYSVGYFDRIAAFGAPYR